MISVVCVRLHVIFTHGFLSQQQSIFTFLWDTEMRDVYRQKKVKTSTTNFHPPVFTLHFDRYVFRTNTYSSSPVWLHPPIFTHAFSPSNFTHLFSTTFFHPLFFTLSFFTLTDSFHALFHRNQFSPTILWALVSPTFRFHLLVDFTHLHISSSDRFHILLYFIFLHLVGWRVSSLLLLHTK